MSRTKKIAVLAIIAMVLTLMPAAMFAATTADSTRLSGAGRVETALDIASAGWTTAGTVILAPADQANLVDALAAAPLAGQENAPVLLTFKGSLDAAVKAKIAALGATKVYVVGAISDAVAAEVDAMTGVAVEALKGNGRQATAAAVNAKLTSPAGTFVVGYDAIPDALSVASFAAKNKYAIMLANADGTFSGTAVGSTKYIVGGTAKVADITGFSRISGSDRFATNKAVAETLAFDYARVYVANGLTCVDALSVAPLAAKYNAFVALSSNSDVAAASVVNAKLNSVSKVIAVGGATAVSDVIVGKVAYAAPSALAVESVQTVGLNTIVVKFNKEVEATSAQTNTNYTLAGANLTASDVLQLSPIDNKTLTIILDVPMGQLAPSVFTVKQNLIRSKDLASTVPAYSANVTFSDSAAPTVTSVVANGNKEVNVQFSEGVKLPAAYLAAAGTKMTIDGSNLVNFGFTAPATATVTATAANSYGYKVKLTFGTAIPAGTHTLKVLAGTATDLIDAAGYKVAEQSITFTVESVTGAPSVTSITAETNGVVQVTFDRSMDTATVVAANFRVSGSATAPTVTAVPGTSNKTWKLSFGNGVVTPGAGVLVINKAVADVYGNVMSSVADVRVAFTAAADTVKPTAKSVTVINNTLIRVIFSEPIPVAYGTNPNNYVLKDSTGNAIATVPAIVGGVTSSDTYELTVAALTGSNYSLKIQNMIDLSVAGNIMDAYTTTFNGIDNVAPTIDVAGPNTGVFQVANAVAAVVFSESMDATTITNTANYSYKDNQAVPVWHALPTGTSITPLENNSAVQITFPASYTVLGGAATEFSVMQLRVANVKDVSGNVIDGVVVSQAIGAIASGSDNATYVTNSFNLFSDPNKVWAEFELNQTVTSLTPADFTVAAQAPDTGYVSGKKVILTFTTAGKITAIKGAGVAATLATVATASKNINGTPIAAIAGQAVYDDQIKPAYVSIAAAAGALPANADTITITFSEAIDASIAGLYTDDFTFEYGGTLYTPTSCAAGAANELVFSFAGTSFAVGNTVVVKAVPANISIKDAKDAALNQNLYVPITPDYDGSRTVTF